MHRGAALVGCRLTRSTCTPYVSWHRTLAPRLDRRHESVPVRETRDDVDVRDRDRGRRGERERRVRARRDARDFAFDGVFAR